ncbi:hypothetical protein AWH56_023645 [Anaerobacillus isosaccharinicus]|uniref:Uncharacterized protein n=1 Tax=Anaerobacillus isosaccharinicus TaxID=1532552 RepID=A0A1S2LIA3_9BACI|nr:hypothetical protein [Anaerobacillus isosaccharinicus]MBA5586101.1 hypothetical protein [Anaerobacillus isosaccharinicus]QOY35630.1 hypothetical protein AWH56_023645 [Anaerobacillus isosaccharinicus]
MEPTILAHIILGSILTGSIIITVFFLLRMLFAPSTQKAIFSARLRKSAIITVILFISYMGWIFIKKMLF